jgi:hypothetical protein
MTAAGPSQHAAFAMVNSIPDREVPFAMLLALKRIVEFSQHLVGVLHVRFRQSTRAYHIGDRNRQQRGIQPVSRNVDEVKREVLGVHPVVANGIAAEGGCREGESGHRDQALHWRRNAVAHVLNAGGKLGAHAIVAEVLQQCGGLRQIGHREAFRETAEHRA